MAIAKPIAAGAWLVSGLVGKATTLAIRKIADDPDIPFLILSNSEESKRYSCKAVVSPKHRKSLSVIEKSSLPAGLILPPELVREVTEAASAAVFACTGKKRNFSDVEIYVTEPGAKQQDMHLDGFHKDYIGVFLNCNKTVCLPTKFADYEYDNDNLLGSTPAKGWNKLPTVTYSWVEGDNLVFFGNRIHGGDNCEDQKVLLYFEVQPLGSDSWYGDQLIRERDFQQWTKAQTKKVLSLSLYIYISIYLSIYLSIHLSIYMITRFRAAASSSGTPD